MRLPVDATNPGEVLACAGLATLSVRAPDAPTGFIEEGGRWVFEFHDALLERIAFPSALTDGQDPARIDLLGVGLDWWNPYGLNPGMKLWAGRQSARSVLGNLLGAAANATVERLFEFRFPTKGRLGVDPAGSWDALGMGFSLNEHTDLEMDCRPFVEALAFIGLQSFPFLGDRHTGFTYSLWRPVPLPLARLAFAGASRFAITRFRSITGKAGSNTILCSAVPI